MAVTGLIHPAKIITNAGAQPGDKLILTKPLGSGVVTTAVKVGEQLGELLTEVIQSMVTLNKAAAEVMQQIGVHACTDITGFGLLGHTYELARASNVGIQIWATAVPIFAGALPLVTRGFVPGGTGNNRHFLVDKVDVSDAISWEHSTLLFDAQTSGGLLIVVAPDRVAALTSALKQAGVATHAVIGEVIAEPRAQVRVLD
jgi:selenide,water dikinase